MTVRQIFSADPAPQIQAFTELRRFPLSILAAAWPCQNVLMNPAPLSRRFSFSTSYHRFSVLSIAIFPFYRFYQWRMDFYTANCALFPVLCIIKAQVHFMIDFFTFRVYNAFVLNIPGCGSVWGAMGAPPAAESSDLSEWPRSADDDGAPSARKLPGTATGKLHKS